jgi:aspartate/methionine/tyrosine aminotransferase
MHKAPLFRRFIMAPYWIAPSTVLKAVRPVKNREFSAFSARGKQAVCLLPDYLADARAVTKYSPETAPHGALQLGVAENKMLEDLLVPALTKFASTHDFASDMIYYQPTQGRPSFRKAFCEYLQRLLNLPKALDPDGLIVGAGCNAVLENLCITLAEPGQGVLIPTPYYAAFEFDLVARAGLSIIPVNTFEHSGADFSKNSIPKEAYYPTKQSLTAALQTAKQEGESPRILLLSHPNNPLGISYPPHVVNDCIEWCRTHEIHLVSDEIYAGSIYREGANFESALKLAGPDLGNYVHFVYALSKDFGLSGLRVGACYSENQEIRLPLQKLNDLCQISSQTQVLVETMMTSTSANGTYWTDNFLSENHLRIRARCDSLQAILTEFDIPYLPADCGLFSWIDFSRYLPPPTEAAGPNEEESVESMQRRERALYLELVNEFGLLFTPGLSQRSERPGFFRCVFTAANDEEFELALERLRKFATAKTGA